jgi:hypothetical protein
MTWLKLIPWKWVGAAAVVGAVLWFHWHQVGEADKAGYARAAGEYKAEEEKQRKAAERRAREEDARAIQDRTKELANVGDIYAARAPAVIRVCVTAPSLPGTPEADSSTESRAAGSGVLSKGDAAPVVTDFDVAPLDELAHEADRIVAECRALQNRIGF